MSSENDWLLKMSVAKPIACLYAERNEELS